MTNKEKIKYLRQYGSITKEMVENENRYAVLVARLTSPGIPKLTDMPKSQSVGRDKMADGVSELIELEKLLEKHFKTLLEMQTVIRESINALPDSLHRRIMNTRYIDGKSWEEVCVELSYSWRQTHRLHSDALNNLKIKGGGQNGDTNI